MLFASVPGQVPEASLEQDTNTLQALSENNALDHGQRIDGAASRKDLESHFFVLS